MAVATVVCSTALVFEPRVVVPAAATALVAPGGGTPSKKMFNHFCLVSERHPARISSAPTQTPSPPAAQNRRRDLFFFKLGGFIGAAAPAIFSSGNHRHLLFR